MNKYFSYMLISGSVILSSCSTWKTVEGPPIVHPSIGMVHNALYRYENISEREVEEALVEQARTSHLEDGWVYRPDENTLLEVGIHEQINTHKFSRYTLRPNDFDIFYHTHPFTTVMGRVLSLQKKQPYPLSGEELTERLRTCNRMSPPSATDISIDYALACDLGRDSLSMRVADANGITSYTVDLSVVENLDSENWLHHYEELVTRYDSLKIDMRDFFLASRELGIDISYKPLDVYRFYIEDGIDRVYRVVAHQDDK